MELKEKTAVAEPLLSPSDKNVSDLPETVCFVCSGNTCRSPMAEAVLNYLGKGKYRALSAGTSACDGDGITWNAEKALKNAGIPSAGSHDYKNHRSRQITYSDIANCDKIVAMTGRHLIQLISAFPEAADKMIAMPKDIPDPFMYGEEVYEKCLDMIIDGLTELFDIDPLPNDYE